jgi:hypothetical protein
MKRILLLLAAACIGVAAHGQSFELGFRAGSAVDLSCQVDTGVDAAWTREVASGLDLGLGLGVRYARPLDQRITTTRNGETTVSREYANDLGATAFGRLRYRFPGSLFLQADAGWRVGMINAKKHFVYAEFVPTDVTGLFVEPQVGWRLDDRRSLALGVSLQQMKRGERINVFTSSDTTSDTYKKITVWSPVAFVRYCLHW